MSSFDAIIHKSERVLFIKVRETMETEPNCVEKIVFDVFRDKMKKQKKYFEVRTNHKSNNGGRHKQLNQKVIKQYQNDNKHKIARAPRTLKLEFHLPPSPPTPAMDNPLMNYQFLDTLCTHVAFLGF